MGSNVSCCHDGAKGLDPAYVVLGWRSAALTCRCEDDETGALTRMVTDGSAGTWESEGTISSVESFLSSDTLLKEPGFTPEGVEALKPAGSDWRGFSAWLLKRIRAVNGLGGPRFMVVSWKTLQHLGRFPMFPTESEHILDAERLLEEYASLQDKEGKVEGRVVCFSFLSHRWERPDLNASKAHPDSAGNKKAKALAKFGEFGTCPIFAPNHDFDYYFWVDYSCIDQVNDIEKFAGISKLSAYVAGCIQIIMYNSLTADYEPRAWTRLERMLGYTYCACPLFKYLDDKYPHEPIDIDTIVKRDPSTFTKGGDGGLLLRIRDPEAMDATLTDKSDRRVLRRLTSSVRDAVPMNPARCWHNITELVFDESVIPLDTEHYGMDVAKEGVPERSAAKRRESL